MPSEQKVTSWTEEINCQDASCQVDFDDIFRFTLGITSSGEEGTMGKGSSKVIYLSSMLIFGSVGLFVRKIPMPSLHIAFLRSLLGTAVMVLIYVLMKKKIDKKAMGDNWINLICAGTFLGLNWILLFEAYKRTTIASATLAYYMAPVIFLILSHGLMKIRLTGIRLITIFLSFMGLMILQMDDGALLGNIYSTGVAFGIAAAFFYALVIIFNRRMKNVNGLDRTLMELFLSLLVLGVYMTGTGEFSRFSIPSDAMVYVLILGILHTGLAYFLYFSTVDKLDAQHVALFSYMDPLSAIIFSSLFLGEKVYVNMILGALLILGSSILFELIGEKEKRRS